MAKKEKKEKKGSGKKAFSKIIMIVLAIILIIVLIASFIFAIFEIIIEYILGVITDAITGFLRFLAHPIKSTIVALGEVGNLINGTFNGNYSGWAAECTNLNQLIEISQDEFQKMKDSLDDSINKELMGFDDLMLKKMLLTYNTGLYSHNADIIIELGSLSDDYEDINGDGIITDDEKEIFDANKELIQKCKTDGSIYSPFELKQGKHLEQLELSLLDDVASKITQFFVSDEEMKAAIKAEREEKEEKQEKYYLCAKGKLIFYNENYNPEMSDSEKEKCELVYYDSESMEKIFEEEFQANMYGGSSDYANSAWDYLRTKCYTDGEKGMKIYGYEKVEEELIEWQFHDTDCQIWDLSDNIYINKLLINDYYLTRAPDGLFLEGGILDTARKEYQLQDIDYYSLVSIYVTPVEFMVDLLNISTSQDFVNAFIELTMAKTEVILKLYKTESLSSTEVTEITNEKVTVDCEAVISAEVTEWDEDGDLLHGFKTDGLDDTKVKVVSVENGKTLFGLADALAVELKVTDLPDKAQAFKVTLTFKASGATETYTYPTDPGDKLINLWGNVINGKDVTFTVKYPFVEPEKKVSNTDEVTRKTTTLTTETKLDIAVEKATTWYGVIKYSNYVDIKENVETINASGTRVKWDSDEPMMVKTSKTKETIKRDSDNEDTIFETKSQEGYAMSEVVNRVERWYAELKADEIAYWIMPGGKLTHDLYTKYGGDKGLGLSNEDELYNIRLTYAMDNGLFDWWRARHYLPQKMTIEAEDYKKGTLYKDVEMKLIKGVSNVEKNYDAFLGLLKNEEGGYGKDAEYKPDGKLVKYKTIYGSEDAVGGLFESSDEMLYSLLESSPYTQGLKDIMKDIFYYANKGDYCITEFEFANIFSGEFEDV